MFANRETSNPKVARGSEARCYRTDYKVRRRTLFKLYTIRYSKWVFPDGRELAESDYLIPFQEDNLNLFPIIRGIYKT